MSRSQRAWTKSRVLVGPALRVAAKLGTDGPQAPRRHERVPHTSSSLPLFTWVATGMMLLVLAAIPADALGNARSPHGRASAAPATRGASPARATTASTSRQSDPQHNRGDSSDGPRSSAGVLAPGAGYSANNGSGAVKALQRRLFSLGYSPGPIDGRYGPLTDSAVIRFQAAHGLRVDGIAGPLTLAVLASAEPVLYPGAGFVGGGSPPVRDLQRKLAAAGYRPGPIDGRYGPLTKRAVIRYQAARHLRIDGIAGPQTLGRLRAGAPGVHTRKHSPSQTPRTTQPNPRPAPRSKGAPGRTAKPSGTRHKTGSVGALPLTSIILLACVLTALLVTALRRRTGPVDGAAVPRRRIKVPQFKRGIMARREIPELAPTPVDVREHAAQQLDDRPEITEEQHAGAAAFRLGLLLAQDGNLVGAEDAFRRADERGHPDAAFELGLLLMHEGDREAAKEAFRRADERGHAEAAYDLGRLMAETGDLAGAKDAFRRAAERGHPDAAFNLGALLVEDGDVPGAENAFRRADQGGDAGAACNLGVLLEQRGDRAGAKEAYRRADQRGHAVGACNLGSLLEDEGDLAGAREAYRRADSRADPIGSYHLGRLLEQAGDRDGAKEAYRRADERGSAEAACNLGFLLKQEGDRDGALQAFKRAGEQGSPAVAQVAHAEMLALSGAEEADR